MIIVLSILFISVLGSCDKKEDNQDPGPGQCLDLKISEFEKTACDSDATVDEYTFQGDTVFVFNPGLCGADMVSAVMDTECSVIGFLGGIEGNTTINGEDFSTAVYLRTVWQN